MLEWIIGSDVLILTVVLLRQLLKGRMGPRLRYALWAVVLVRLLLPVNLGSAPISVMHTAERVPLVQAAEQVQNVTRVEHMSSGVVEGIPRYEQMPDAPLQVSPHSTPEEFHRMETALSLREVLVPLWKLGTGAFLLVLLLSNLRFSGRVRRSRKRVEQTEIPLPVYTAAVDTPCLFGVLSPAVYVTAEAAEDPGMLRHALAHEYTHFRQGDHVWAVLRGAALAIHWYDPLVWLAAFLSRQDAELSCDEGTVRRLGEAERAAYGRTLLRLTCEKRSFDPLNAATTMNGSGSAIRERIVLLTRRQRTTAAVLAAAVLVTAAAVGCTFTGAEDPAEPENPNLFTWGELSVELPEAYMELLTVEQSDGSEYGRLLSLWDTASLERARADGIQDPRAEGWGWICTLVRHDRKQVEEHLIGEAPGLEYMAKDDEYWYGLSCPTDVRLYTSDGVYGGQALETWEQANQVTDLLMKEFVSRNGLTPWTWQEIWDQWHPYESEHLDYLWTPAVEPEMNELRLVLSQPARQGAGGIWCVERFSYTGSYGSSFYFPDSPGMNSLVYYEGVQEEHDAGTRMDHATPEAAIAAFLRDNPFMEPQTLAEGTLTRLGETLTVTSGNYTVVLPAGAQKDNLLIETGDGENGPLLSVYEKRSVELARADGLEDPKSWGWLFSLIRCDRKTFERQQMELHSYNWFAWDGEGTYYARMGPTDVRLYRGPEGAYTQEDWAMWEACAAVGGEALLTDFTERNGLIPVSGELYAEIELYQGPHRYYLWSGEHGEGELLILSQPVRTGPEGIWCVERFCQGPWMERWFPDHGELTALEFYRTVQEQRDRGQATGYDTPEAAIASFYAEAGNRVTAAHDPSELTELAETDRRVRLCGLQPQELQQESGVLRDENGLQILHRYLRAAAIGPLSTGALEGTALPEETYTLPGGDRLTITWDPEQPLTELRVGEASLRTEEPELWEFLNRTMA